MLSMLSVNDEKSNSDKKVAEMSDDSERKTKDRDSVCCSKNDCFSRSSEDENSYGSSKNHDFNCELKTISDSLDSKSRDSDDGSRFRACMNFEYPVVSDDREQDTTAPCLQGLIRTDGHGRRLILLDGNTVYWRGHRSTSKKNGRVKVLAGHRGGHYPAFACYVGAGMLDAAIAGPNHGRQPSANHILMAIRELDDGWGVLVLVADELSARINYGIAATRARSQGIDVKLLAVGDDVVRCRPTVGSNCCRRRGAAGLVLVCKIAGAMSSSGHGLAEIFDSCQRLSVDRMTTVNAMIHKIRSYAGNDRNLEQDFQNTTECDENLLLVGTDANGRNAMQTVRTTGIAEMVSAVLKVLSTSGDNDFQDIQRWRYANLVVMVNNLGGMSDARFMVVVAEVAARLTTDTGVRNVHRWYTGRMLSSAGDRNNGFSVTVMDVSVSLVMPRDCIAASATVDGPRPSLLDLLDIPVITSGWTFTGPEKRPTSEELPVEYIRRPRYEASPLSDDDDDDGLRTGPSVADVHVPFVTDVLNHVCDRIVEAEGRLNALDAADDSDCGSNWRRGATALREAVAAGRVNAAKPADALREISRLMETVVAGTLGSLLAVLFRSWSRTFREHSEHKTAAAAIWVDGLGRGVLAVKVYGMCQPGQRTMLDALVPAVRGMSIVLRESKNPVHLLSRAVRAAKTAVDQTDVNFRPDAGAYGVKIVLEAILEKYLEPTIDVSRKRTI